MRNGKFVHDLGLNDFVESKNKEVDLKQFLTFCPKCTGDFVKLIDADSQQWICCDCKHKFITQYVV